MSGTGPTCFIICKNKKDSAEILKKLRNNFPDYFIRESKLLSST